MKFKIYGTYQDGTEDTWIIESDDFEGIREQAKAVVEGRNLKNYRSEEIKD